MQPEVSALNVGVGPCWEKTCGDFLEAMARITPSQPNDAMARFASRRTEIEPFHSTTICQVKISERGSLDVDSKLFSKVQIDSKEDWARWR